LFINDSLLSEFEEIIEGHCGCDFVVGAENFGFVMDKEDNLGF